MWAHVHASVCPCMCLYVYVYLCVNVCTQYVYIYMYFSLVYVRLYVCKEEHTFLFTISDLCSLTSLFPGLIIEESAPADHDDNDDDDGPAFEDSSD